jgi:hypothetical protein
MDRDSGPTDTGRVPRAGLTPFAGQGRKIAIQFPRLIELLEDAMRRPSFLRSTLLFAFLLAGAALGFSALGHAGSQNLSTTEKPFVIEYYYKTKWGHADEFITLFRKNHYPLLKKEVELGRLLKVTAVAPVYHTTEDGRWDYRVTIVYKNAAVANDGYDSTALQKQLFPDQETYKKEEQRRFEILEAHWDLPVKDVDLEAR